MYQGFRFESPRRFFGLALRPFGWDARPQNPAGQRSTLVEKHGDEKPSFEGRAKEAGAVFAELRALLQSDCCSARRRSVKPPTAIVNLGLDLAVLVLLPPQLLSPSCS